jgi:hypothetical protein
VTDLEWVTPTLFSDGQTADALIEARIATPLGPIFKRLRFSATAPRVEFEIVLDWKDWGRGSLRLGNFLLNPSAFDRDALAYRTHNGGKRLETFEIKNKPVDHGKPISFLVSASTGIGMTEGWVEVGDDERSFRVDVDHALCPLIGLMHYEPTGDSWFSRLSLSALELDETRKPEPVSGPRHFRFALSLNT